MPIPASSAADKPKITTRPTAELLPNLPRGPLSPQQHMDAVRRAQAQAEQRVALGMQLFKAAEARVAHHQDMLDQVKQEHERLRDTLTDDVTKTLHQYDQWIGGIDENFTGAMQQLEARMAKLESRFDEEQAKLAQIVERTEALLAQARGLLNDAPRDAAAPEVGSTVQLMETETEGDASADVPSYQHLLRRLQSGPGPDRAA